MHGTATSELAGTRWHLVWALIALAGLALAGCANLWPAAPASAPSTVTRYDRGTAAFAAGHFGLAVKAFHEAVDEAPGSVAALNGLAAAYDHLGRYDLAARYYGRAMALDPNAPQTLNNIGYSYMLQGKFDLAAIFLRDAQRRDPDDPAIAANRVIAEAALRASQTHPGAQWRDPSTKGTDPPRAKIERTTPIVQTLVARPVSLTAWGTADAWMPPPIFSEGPVPPAATDTLPAMLAAPMGDTRMAAAYDRLPRPLPASMADAWLAAPPAHTSRGVDRDLPG